MLSLSGTQFHSLNDRKLLRWHFTSLKAFKSPALFSDETKFYKLTGSVKSIYYPEQPTKFARVSKDLHV